MSQLKNSIPLSIHNKHRVGKRVWVSCIISFLGIYAAISSHTIALVVFIINLATIAWFNEQEIFCELMFLMPFTMIYKINAVSTSLFTYLVLVATLVFLLKRGRIEQRIIPPFLFMAMYMLIGVGNNFADYMKLLINIMLTLLFTDMIRRENFSRVVLSLSLGVILSSFVGLRKSSWPTLAGYFSNMKEEYINGVMKYRFTGLYMDPNYFSIIIMICIFGLLCFVYLKEIDFKIGIPMTIALIVFGILTYSRLFYVCLLFVFIIIFIIRIKVTQKVGSSIFIALLTIGLGLFSADKYGIINNIMYRFYANDISNNRFIIWNNYLSYLGNSLKTLFLGDGIGAPYYYGVGPHNFYIEIIYYLGIIGGIVYLFLYASILFKKQDRIIKRGILDYAMTFVLLIMFGTLGMLFSNDFPFIVMMDWVFLNIGIQSNFLSRNHNGINAKKNSDNNIIKIKI